MVRDPLVSLNPDDPTLLLGRSYVHLGGVLRTPSYFVLHGPTELDYVPAAMERWGAPPMMLPESRHGPTVLLRGSCALNKCRAR